jgi:hypothetical protein
MCVRVCAQAHAFEACLALRLALKHERHNALGWTAQARAAFLCMHTVMRSADALTR